MRVSESRTTREKRIQVTSTVEQQQEEEQRYLLKAQRRRDMDAVRKETVQSLNNLIFSLEPPELAKKIKASVTPILSSARAPYGMIIAFEFKLKEHGVDNTKWEGPLQELKVKASEKTNPNKYY